MFETNILGTVYSEMTEGGCLFNVSTGKKKTYPSIARTERKD